jgi:hypothetical protein
VERLSRIPVFFITDSMLFRLKRKITRSRRIRAIQKRHPRDPFLCFIIYLSAGPGEFLKGKGGEKPSGSSSFCAAGVY